MWGKDVADKLQGRDKLASDVLQMDRQLSVTTQIKKTSFWDQAGVQDISAPRKIRAVAASMRGNQQGCRQFGCGRQKEF
jgi:hypothetical protein